MREEPAQHLPPGLSEERGGWVGRRYCTHIAYDCTRITYRYLLGDFATGGPPRLTSCVSSSMWIARPLPPRHRSKTSDGGHVAPTNRAVKPGEEVLGGVATTCERRTELGVSYIINL